LYLLKSENLSIIHVECEFGLFCFFLSQILLYFSDYCDVPELITQLQTNYQYWKERDEEIGEQNEQENLPNGTTDDDT
jgi:hypothetical protein